MLTDAVFLLEFMESENKEKGKPFYKLPERTSHAIAEGVQSLLRENIVANFNKYHQDRKHCPIYAKESLKRVYRAYHNLGGNDVATALYEKVLDMPEEPETTEKERSDENDE